jgi:chemotaxis protein methyltransferase CheR
MREQITPLLRTYPFLKVWVAGCSTGEEVYSLAILLHEEGLLTRTQIYATDINAKALERAQAGVYSIDRIPAFTENHRKSGARTSLSDYYTAAYGGALFDAALKRHIVFSDHSLATDSVFAEVQLVSCRNVLIYFNRILQDRAIGLFHEALSHKGFLGIGAKESLRFSSYAEAFGEFAQTDRIYQKKAS